MEQELRVARHIQHSLLPKNVPKRPGWEIATYYQPARAVGGDFYDFLELPDGRLVFIIGDVTDKGIPAALVMATTRSTLRAAAQRLISPSQVLAQANELICADIPKAMFVTCLYAVLDPNNGRLRYANAGHSLPYWRRDSRVIKLWATGMPLGLMPDQAYEEKEITIAAGENVLFYSDGLMEAHNRDRQILGPAHLQTLIANHTGDPPLIDVLVSKLAQFTGHDIDPEDDVTLVTLSRMQAGKETTKKIQPRKTSQKQPGTLPTPLPVPCTQWRALAHFELPSKRGQDGRVMQLISEVTASLNLSPRRRERLQTAVTEAVLNAMEHGHGYDPTKLVSIEMLFCEAALLVRISQGEGPPIPTPKTPDLATKVAGREEPRGWGLFLMENLVDDMRIHNSVNQRTIELIMHLENNEDASTTKTV
jgi:anti-sigma regulatory factor (Ser/Thr protein kinase)